MATQWQKYVGNNAQNNEVRIDFKKKRVEFKPVEKVPISIFVKTVSLMFALPIFLVMYLLVTVMEILTYEKDFPIKVQLIRSGLFILYIIIPTAIAYIVGNIYAKKKLANKKWKREEFPKVNAWIINRIRGANTLRVNKGYGKKEVIFGFRNVKLEYKLYGQYAKYIRWIIIEKVKGINSGRDWIAKFIFSKPVYTGKMEVIYI